LDVCIFGGRWVLDDDGGKRIESFSVEGGEGRKGSEFAVSSSSRQSSYSERRVIKIKN
jgi:hypothetical protein